MRIVTILVLTFNLIVKSFGTENRPVSKHVPPRSEVYEYIIFRGSDIKDLHVSEVNKQEEQPPDPAILSVSAQAVSGASVKMCTVARFALPYAV